MSVIQLGLKESRYFRGFLEKQKKVDLISFL